MTTETDFYFEDLSGHRWSLKCSLADAMMLEENPKIAVSPDMFADERAAKSLLFRLSTETFLSLRIVVELTRAQRQGQSVEYEGETIDVSDDRQFCQLLEGKVLDKASRAFLAGLANVTPKLVRVGILEALESFDREMETAAAQIPDAIRKAASVIGS